MEYIKSTLNTSENVDRESQIQYNNSNEIRFSTKTAKYVSYDMIGNTDIRRIKFTLEKLYEENDGIMNDVAVESGNVVYIVDSGRENGNITFGVRRIKKITDKKLRYDFVRSTNNDALSEGYISDELSSRFRNKIGSDFGRDMRRESGEELSADTRESTNNERRVSNKDAN